MNPLSAPLARSPELFPLTLDSATDTVSLIRLSEADYQKTSFLDQRVLTPQTVQRTLPFSELRAAVADTELAEACDFIFHIGHVGSTLLSRLLGRHQRVFALREPAALRVLAQIQAEGGWRGERFEEHLAPLLKLWSRTFQPGQRTLLKATSFASELAQEILARPSAPKAIFLFVPPENFLASILGAQNSPQEALALAPLRAKRLQRRGVEIAPSLSIGEIVAMGWACEMTALCAADAGERVLWLDFDAFLARPNVMLATCFDHLEIAATGEEIAAILAGPDMRRYAKAQEYDYDAKLRASVLAQAHVQHGDEIKRGQLWLERQAAKHPVIAEALLRAG